MKKLITGMLLGLVLMLGMMPMRAEAANQLWIGSVELQKGEYLANGSTTATTTEPQNGYAQFSADGKLILNNFTVDSSGFAERNFSKNIFIYAKGELEVVLEDGTTNTVNGGEKSAFYSDSSLTITGDTGVLQASTAGKEEVAIMAYYDVTINGGEIHATNEAEDGYGIQANNRTLTINGGTITAICAKSLSFGSDKGYALRGADDIIINGGTVTAISQAGRAMNKKPGFDNGYTPQVSAGEDIGSLAPVPASNEDTYTKSKCVKIEKGTLVSYDIWVGGTRITNLNAGNVFDDGKVSYDAANNVLKLNGYVYEGEENAAIYAKFSDTLETLEIAAEGTNHLTGANYGVYIDNGKVKLSGNGTTTISGTKNGIYTSSVGNSINGGVVTVSGGEGAMNNVLSIAKDYSIPNGYAKIASGDDESTAVQTFEENNYAINKKWVKIEPRIIYVGDTLVTREHADDQDGRGWYYYAGDQNTRLVFTGLNLNGLGYKIDDDIYASIYSNVDLRMELLGDYAKQNTITNTASSGYALFVEGEITFMGRAQLEAKANKAAMNKAFRFTEEADTRVVTASKNSTGADPVETYQASDIGLYKYLKLEIPEDYGVIVAGEEVNSKNLKGSGWEFIPANGTTAATLILDNLSYGSAAATNDCGIMASNDLIIELRNNNKFQNVQYGILTLSNLTIKGTGKLEITDSVKEAILKYGGSPSGSFVITGDYWWRNQSNGEYEKNTSPDSSGPYFEITLKEPSSSDDDDDKTQNPGTNSEDHSDGSTFKEMVYVFIEGKNSTWAHTNREGALFKINAPYEKFLKVLVDGKIISSDKYTSESGSTIVTLKRSYLKTLDHGEHTLEVKFTDGYAKTTFKVTDEVFVSSGTNYEAGTTPPATGDDSNITWYVTLMLAACVGIAVATVGKRQKKH